MTCGSMGSARSTGRSRLSGWACSWINGCENQTFPEEELAFLPVLCNSRLSLWFYSKATLPTDGYVVTYNDGSSAVAVGGSLTHPNDLGMEKIVGRIIDILNL